MPNAMPRDRADAHRRIAAGCGKARRDPVARGVRGADSAVPRPGDLPISNQPDPGSSLRAGHRNRRSPLNSRLADRVKERGQGTAESVRSIGNWRERSLTAHVSCLYRVKEIRVGRGSGHGQIQHAHREKGVRQKASACRVQSQITVAQAPGIARISRSSGCRAEELRDRTKNNLDRHPIGVLDDGARDRGVLGKSLVNPMNGGLSAPLNRFSQFPAKVNRERLGREGHSSQIQTQTETQFFHRRSR